MTTRPPFLFMSLQHVLISIHTRLSDVRKSTIVWKLDRRIKVKFLSPVLLTIQLYDSTVITTEVWREQSSSFDQEYEKPE